jgi:pullulanase/glycogen debranching enzyme
MRYLYDLVRTLGLSVIEIPLLPTAYCLTTNSLSSKNLTIYWNYIPYRKELLMSFLFASKEVCNHTVF